MSKVKVGDKIKLIKKMGPLTEVGTICTISSINDGWIKFSSPAFSGYGCMFEDELDTYFEIVKEDEDISDNELQDSIFALKERLRKLEEIAEERKENARMVPLCELKPGDRFVTSGKREYVVLNQDVNGVLVTTCGPYAENVAYKLIQFDSDLTSSYQGSALEKYINDFVYLDLYKEFSGMLLDRTIDIVTLDGALTDTLTGKVFPISFDEVRRYKKYLENIDFDSDNDVYWTITPWSDDIVFNGNIVCAYFIGGISNNCDSNDQFYIRPTCLVESDIIVKRVDDQE